LAVADGTPFSLFLAALFVFAWLPRWRSLEESELVARFGEDYREYMNRVPALFPASLEMELELLRSVLRARRELPVAEEGAA
jgi:protein-S-isoprenylcysteine O-methyltransferase Ste14